MKTVCRFRQALLWLKGRAAPCRLRKDIAFAATFAVLIVATMNGVSGQARGASNGYQRVENWAQLPQGMLMGGVIGAEPGPDGNVYVFRRSDPPILKLDPAGKILKSWGTGMFSWPHGLHLDREGNVWVADVERENIFNPVPKFTQGNAAEGKGHQVFKFSADGNLLMTLGRAGVKGDGPDTFFQPTDIVTAPNGDIFVTEGHHGTGNNSVAKFSKDGKFIKRWGEKGVNPEEFDEPHAIAMDSQGRLFIADRLNSRIQIFDQEGRYLDQWRQFGVPNGIYIMKDDTMYVSDGFSWHPGHKGAKKGITIGSAKDGSVKTFIEDPQFMKKEHSGFQSVGVDAKGNIYGADVFSRMLVKYAKE